MAKRWIPDKEVRDLVVKHSPPIRDHDIGKLYDSVEFKLKRTWFMSKPYLTVSKNKVFFYPSLAERKPATQAQEIVHELTHCAQWDDLGVVGFPATYSWEFIRSGFSYKRMRKRGLEKEAYDNESMFRINVRRG